MSKSKIDWSYTEGQKNPLYIHLSPKDVPMFPIKVERRNESQILITLHNRKHVLDLELMETEDVEVIESILWTLDCTENHSWTK